MPPDPHVHVAVAAIVKRGNDLLLTQRGDSKADGFGKWALPGGWLEFHEFAFDAAFREVQEETGLEVRPVKDDGFFIKTSEDGQRHVVTLIILCDYLGGEPVNKEPEKTFAVRWMAMELLVELDLFETLDYWWRRPHDIYSPI